VTSLSRRRRTSPGINFTKLHFGRKLLDNFSNYSKTTCVNLSEHH
jgi:hypothetical protein